MKVVLTHGYFIEEDEKEQKIRRPYPPLGILYISAWLEHHGYHNEVFDTTFETKAGLKRYLLAERPQVLGLYTNLMTKVNVIDIIHYIKTTQELKEIVIVLGGPDVRHNIADYLSTGADVAVFGEGEQTMLELVKAIEQGVRTEFAHIDGVAYTSAEYGLIKNAERDKIKDINELPIPNRKKIDMDLYLKTWKEAHGLSAMTVSTQRGCPYTCKWCSTAVYGQSYRRRKPKKVAEELRYLKNTYAPDTIWFVDDVFTVSHKWLKEFRDEVIKQDAIIPFECITRADRMNEDVVNWLKEAGAFRIWIGAESGSQKVIDLMDRRVDISTVRNMIHLTKNNGMQAGTFIMLGYPGETEEDIVATANHLKDCDPDEFTITVAYPIKGTSLYTEVEAIQTRKLNWEETTDRDRDFRRTYPREYYDYAVRWVDNEVRRHQSYTRNEILSIRSLKYMLKSQYFRMRMRYGK